MSILVIIKEANKKAEITFMDTNERQKQVLKTVVEEYVKHSAPIGSGHVVEMLAMPVSSATVRNDMVILTDLGLLEQPHTSAGRIPTSAGYKIYIDMTMKERKELSRRQREILTKHFSHMKNMQEKFKEAARLLSELSGNVSLLVDEADKVYMSGLSNIPKLPEFRDEEFSEDFMELLEDPATYLKGLVKKKNDSKILLAGENNSKTSIVITRFGSDGKKVISVIGPMRMHYGKALPAVEYIAKLLNEDEIE